MYTKAKELVAMPKNDIALFDTTLRDGSQSADINFSLKDKLELVQAMDSFGFDYIELGWPGSNPKDIEAFRQAAKLKLKNSRIVAFGSTRRKRLKAEDDFNLQAIVKSKAPVACIFGKTWLQHVEKQLQMSPEQNIEAIKDSILFLAAKKLEVLYDLEHFFEGFKDNREYALSCIRVASEAGAKVVVLCDTNGGTLAAEVEQIVREVRSFMQQCHFRAEIGVHFHNDSGVAVANTLAAVELGATHVQGTLNGFGERTGNVDLIQVIPALALKMGKSMAKVNLKELFALSGFAYTLAAVKPNSRQPYVGRNAFSHKGGIHVDAVMKGASYEHVNPQAVGNSRSIVLSDLSGKANIVEVAKRFGYSVTKDNPAVAEMLQAVEQMEKEGYDIGSLEAEQFLLAKRFFGKGEPLFDIMTWKATSERREGKEYSSCILKATVKGKEKDVVAEEEGGPVGAIFKAVGDLLGQSHKNAAKVLLTNYKVMIAEDHGAESSVRVYIEFQENGSTWGTAGVSANILEASLMAIEKGFSYALLK